MKFTDIPSITEGIINAPDALLSQSVIVTFLPLISCFIGLASAFFSVGLVLALGFFCIPQLTEKNTNIISVKILFITENILT